MSRNEITLQEMFSLSHRGTPGRRQVGTAHLPVSGECILGIHQMATDAHAQAEPDRTEEIRKLPQAEELQLEHRIHLHQDGTLGVSSGGGQKVHTVCTQTVRACVYRHTGGQEEGARSIRHQQPGKGETERSLQGGTLPNTQQRTRIFFVLMFMLRGIPFVDLAYLHKRDLQGNVLSYRRRKTGRALTVSLHTRSHADGQDGGEQESRFPYLFPILQSEEGTEAAYREYQSALRGFNQRLAVLRQCLGMQSALSTYAARHTWATMAYHCEIHPESYRKPWGTPPLR